MICIQKNIPVVYNKCRNKQKDNLEIDKIIAMHKKNCKTDFFNTILKKIKTDFFKRRKLRAKKITTIKYYTPQENLKIIYTTRKFKKIMFQSRKKIKTDFFKHRKLRAKKKGCKA